MKVKSYSVESVSNDRCEGVVGQNRCPNKATTVFSASEATRFALGGANGRSCDNTACKSQVKQQVIHSAQIASFGF